MCVEYMHVSNATVVQGSDMIRMSALNTSGYSVFCLQVRRLLPKRWHFRWLFFLLTAESHECACIRMEQYCGKALFRRIVCLQAIAKQDSCLCQHQCTRMRISTSETAPADNTSVPAAEAIGEPSTLRLLL
jgi:hypothetical protein